MTQINKPISTWKLLDKLHNINTPTYETLSTKDDLQADNMRVISQFISVGSDTIEKDHSLDFYIWVVQKQTPKRDATIEKIRIFFPQHPPYTWGNISTNYQYDQDTLIAFVSPESVLINNLIKTIKKDPSNVLDLNYDKLPGYFPDSAKNELRLAQFEMKIIKGLI